MTIYSTMNFNASIYIPRMSIEWTEHKIRQVMHNFGVGTVSYIDFTSINKKPGFKEDIDSHLMSAFVHFVDPDISKDGNYNWMSGAPLGDFWTAILNGESYKLQVTLSEYWICLKNKNPIKRTLMNIHQVAENGRYLENLIFEQGEELKKLQSTVNKMAENNSYLKNFISEQAENIKNLKNTVYQLLGGLYCQKTQAGILNYQLKFIGCSNIDTEITNDTHPFGSWPTTRQGDENRERIEKLEETIKQLLEFNSNNLSFEE